LPRAGTTLLGTILKQNPTIDASISGPLARFVRSIITESSTQGGYRFECPPEKRKNLIAGLFENYYDDRTKTICVNHNRGWGLLFHTIKDLYPTAKMVMCVRPVVEVINSFEWLYRKQPYSFTNIFNGDENTNVYTRAEALLPPGKTVGFAYAAMKQTISSEYKNDIAIVEYKQLATNPQKTVEALYKFLGIPAFSHDFNDVEASYDEFDRDVGLEGLHNVRKSISYKPQEMILPPDLQQMITQTFPDVWR
jgi:sulfotransferase